MKSSPLNKQKISTAIPTLLTPNKLKIANLQLTLKTPYKLIDIPLNFKTAFKPFKQAKIIVINSKKKGLNQYKPKFRF